MRLLSGQVMELVVAVEMHLGSCAISDSLPPFSNRSLIVVSPAAASNVGNQSSPEKISVDTSPALICPGQRIMAGTRNAPSQLVSFSLRNGVVAASGQRELIGTVVGRVDHDGVICYPQVIERFEELAYVLIVLNHAIGIFVARHPAWPRMDRPHMREYVHARDIHPEEERLAGLDLTPDVVDCGADRLVVNGFHALFRQRAGILDGLLTDAAPVRVHSAVIFVARFAMKDAARRVQGNVSLSSFGQYSRSGSSSAFRW